MDWIKNRTVQKLTVIGFSGGNVTSYVRDLARIPQKSFAVGKVLFASTFAHLLNKLINQCVSWKV